MKYIVDRIENNIVVCENQQTKKIEEFSKEQFPEKIKSGDVVILKDGKFEIREDETKNKKKYIDDLMKRLMISKWEQTGLKNKPEQL